jgi:hypothetical protein
MARRPTRVAGRYKYHGRSASTLPTKGLRRRLLMRPAAWIIGIVLASTATVVGAILTGIPSQLFDARAVKDQIRPGGDISVVAEIVYLADEDRSMATGENYSPDAQLRHMLAQPGAAGGESPQFTQRVRAVGGANLNKLTIRTTLEGRRNQQVRIFGLRPEITESGRPLAGTLFDTQPQAPSPNLQLKINFEEPSPVVREVVTDPDTQEQRDGDPYFDRNTISLDDREQQVLNVRAEVSSKYIAFRLAVDYRLGNGQDMKTFVVDNNGQPFRISGYHFNEDKQLSYQRVFWMQEDFSFCELVSATVDTSEPACMA